MSPAHNSPPPHISPSHTAPGSSNTFEGSPFRFYYTEEMWREQQAREEERDDLFYAMHEKQQEMRDFMQESQRQNMSTFQSILEAQRTLADQ